MFKTNIKPPYYAVIFSSIRTDNNEGYEDMDNAIYQKVKDFQGYLGHEALRNENGFGIHISYWKTLNDIKAWKNDKLHTQAKNTGKEKWYSDYSVRICKVEQVY